MIHGTLLALINIITETLAMLHQVIFLGTSSMVAWTLGAIPHLVLKLTNKDLLALVC